MQTHFGSKTSRLAALFVAAGTLAAFPASVHAGNTWQSPFAPNSIWNTQVGSGAQLVNCNLGVLGALDNDRDNLFVTSSSDPYYSVDQPGTSNAQNGVNLWSGFNLGLEPNGGAAFLLPDGVTSREYNYFEVDSPGAQPYGWYWGDHNITGDGLGGGHAGGNMSVLGGTIRVGEIESSAIAHALKIELDWAVLYHSSTNQANESQTYRWPAQNSDGNFGGTGPGPGYTGTNSALCMGSLCCLPKSLNLSTLGLSAKGLKIAQAFQNYGAYVVDTTGNHWQWGNGGYPMGLCVEKQETINNSGYFYNPNNYINSGTFYNDMNAIYQHLAVVNNNSASSIGGGGSSTNVAINKTATASSSYDTVNYIPSKGVDNNINTGWSPTGTDTDPWLEVDLGQAYTITQINLVTRQDIDQANTRRNFAIWASNNGDMSKGHVVLGTQGGTSLPYKATYSVNVTDQTKYRYIAAIKTTNEYFFIGELQVIGH